jgi:type I restriction enzyme M protein
LRIYGQEVNQTTAGIARMNLYLHDIEDFRIARGDTLREPKLKNADGSLQRFDIIVANPPFSLKKWGRETWAEDPYGRSRLGIPPGQFGDFAFVEHMVATMVPGHGRIAVVMPHGVLFRAGVEREIRRRLIQSGVLDAVIGLPPNLFYNTAIPACILVCRHQLPQDRRGRILLVDASSRFVKGRNQNEMGAADVEAIVAAYRAGEDPDGAGGIEARAVSLEEIEANGYDLGFTRYLIPEAADEIDVAAAVERLSLAQEAFREAEGSLMERLRAAGYA